MFRLQRSNFRKGREKDMAKKKIPAKPKSWCAGRERTGRSQPIRLTRPGEYLPAGEILGVMIRRDDAQVEIAMALRPDRPMWSDEILKVIVDKIMGLGPSAYRDGKLNAGETGRALSANPVAVMRIAMEHRDAIVPTAHHPLAPHLWLNSYWRERVMKEIGDRDWWKAWGELLMAVKGFVVPREFKSVPDGEAEFHHPANVDTIRELVRALYDALVVANEIRPVSTSIPPPRKRARVTVRRGEARIVPSSDEDPPWWDLIVRIGGTMKKWCASYRHQFEELGEVPAMACCLGLYFDPPPSFTAHAASPSNAKKASRRPGKPRRAYITDGSRR